MRNQGGVKEAIFFFSGPKRFPRGGFPRRTFPRPSVFQKVSTLRRRRKVSTSVHFARRGNLSRFRRANAATWKRFSDGETFHVLPQGFHVATLYFPKKRFHVPAFSEKVSTLKKVSPVPQDGERFPVAGGARRGNLSRCGPVETFSRGRDVETPGNVSTGQHFVGAGQKVSTLRA